MNRFLKAILVALCFAGTWAVAQDITNHAVPIGGGPGAVGWKAAGPCLVNQALVWANITSDPTCVTVTGGGGGAVTSVIIAAGQGIAVTGTCSISTIGTCTIAATGPTIRSITANDSAVAGDCGKFLALGGNAQFTLTVPAASTLPAQCIIWIGNVDILASSGRGKIMAINGVTFPFHVLYPQMSFALMNNNQVSWKLVGLPSRYRLPSAMTLTVDVISGDDANDGLVASGAGSYLTFQAAMDVAAADVDCGGAQQLAIQGVTAQTYTGIPITRFRDPIGCRSDYTSTTPIIRGDPAGNPANYQVNCGSAVTCFVGVHSTAGWKIVGFSLVATGGSSCVESDNGSQIYISALVLDCDGLQLIASYKGTLEVVGNITTFGPSTSVFYSAQNGQLIMAQFNLDFATGSSASQVFLGQTIDNGLLTFAGSTFSGSTTQSSFCLQATYGGVISIGGVSLPCSTPGNYNSTPGGQIH